MNPVAMILLLVSTTAVFTWSAIRRYRLLTIGQPEPRFSFSWDELVPRFQDLAIIALGQKKMPRGKYTLAGLAHAAIFGGFSVLTVNTIVLWGRGFDPHFDVWGLLAEGTLIGDGYNLIKEFFAASVAGGCLVFFYYRLVLRSKRMTLGVEGLIILGIISTMMLADFLYNGARLVLEMRATGSLESVVAFRPFEPIASLLGRFLSTMDTSTVVALEHFGFWWHSAFVLFFLNLLPYSKHFHVITSLPNVFARPSTPVGALPEVKDIDGKLEREEAIGVAKVSDLSWKSMLDLYTCTECGRCSDNCPAYTTGKKLSPKHLTLALRDHLYESEHALFGSGLPAHGAHELHTNPPAPEGAYTPTGDPGVELVPHVISPDVIWACTTCRACEEQCPVMISYVDKIVDLRRHQVVVKNEFPAELGKPFTAMERNGNPWNYSALERAQWADGLDVPLIADHPKADVLFWVGCAASFDDRAKKIAQSVAKLLKHAGVNFAILGTEESCTGDPARRAGHEYLFQILAANNVDTLKRYGIAKHEDEATGARRVPIVTTCPHCFNVLLNEYPQLGGHYEVVHHTDFLNGLIAQRKLVPTLPVKAKIAYHDSCYLGRYNEIFESPRKVLESIPGVELVEAAYWNKRNGLCCGAGGAQMFMEEQNKDRVNKKRTLQLIDTGATTIASACPFCMTMLTDGIKAEEKSEAISQLDVAELLAQAVDMSVKSDASSATAA